MNKSIAPIFPSNNIEATKMFYSSKLNFKVIEQSGNLVVSDGNIEIHFYKTSNNEHGKHSSCYIFVNNIEDMYLRLSAYDIIRPSGQLVINESGNKEFIVEDNNGNWLRFTEKK
jgi:hypothetical protein